MYRFYKIINEVNEVSCQYKLRGLQYPAAARQGGNICGSILMFSTNIIENMDLHPCFLWYCRAPGAVFSGAEHQTAEQYS